MDAVAPRATVLADAENHSSGPKGRHCKNHTGNHFPKASDFPQKQEMEERKQ